MTRLLRPAIPLVLCLSLAACEDSKPVPAAAPAPAAAPGSVGGSLAIKGANLIFDRIYLESPAAKAGLKPGDRILKINGLPTTTMNMDAAKASFKGAVGTPITLTVASGEAPPRDVTLTRENVTSKIPMPTPGAPESPATPTAPPAPTAPAAPAVPTAPAAPKALGK